jgi:hypothetical protein
VWADLEVWAASAVRENPAASVALAASAGPDDPVVSGESAA